MPKTIKTSTIRLCLKMEVFMNFKQIMLIGLIFGGYSQIIPSYKQELPELHRKFAQIEELYRTRFGNKTTVTQSVQNQTAAQLFVQQQLPRRIIQKNEQDERTIMVIEQAEFQKVLKQKEKEQKLKATPINVGTLHNRSTKAPVTMHSALRNLNKILQR